MDDYFQFIVMNCWKINRNLPFLFGDRQAVKSGSLIFPLRTCIGWETLLSMKVFFVCFFFKGGGGGDVLDMSSFIFQPFITCFKIEINHSLR